MASENMPTVVIVGAGPVGCLTALALAKEGWKVAVYEGRADMRCPSSRQAMAQRSVNLAISSRGLAALYAVEPKLMERIMENALPMRGRLLHTSDGKTESQLYDRNGQCINSIDRGLLNEVLLEEVLNFSEEDKRNVDIHFDLCVGTDGSYSNVRRQMMRVTRMDYQQEYIPHDYVELKIPAGVDGRGQPEFLLDPNHLHIWPRHSFMLIALPNKDKSFTATLFAPRSELNLLPSRAVAAAWFWRHFPDVIHLVGEEMLLNDFEKNPRNSLISIKATPYHYKDRCIILGDAAHSMVPFYGQGLNCGLEDVRVLINLMRREEAIHPRTREDMDVRLERAFERYSETRHEDLVAIRDLAMDNYVEMRHSVTTPAYLFRKMIDNTFAALTAPHVPFSSLLTELAKEPTGFGPSSARGWLPLYTMVTFRPDISYSTAKKKAERQSSIITTIGAASLGVGILAGMRMILGFRRRGAS